MRGATFNKERKSSAEHNTPAGGMTPAGRPGRANKQAVPLVHHRDHPTGKLFLKQKR